MIFDIHKTIVVDDFETLVRGLVDYIDSDTYEITRKVMDVPINHCDGCGMILPRVNRKNFMIRLPWLKGLLSPFPFDDFCRELGLSGDIIDIYGVTKNIFRDEIEIIFTKSQFKLHKYYVSWQDYIDKYIENECQAGFCNEDSDRNKVKDAKFNYQMLQTLVDLTNDELLEITRQTRDDIYNISRDRKTMLKVFGINDRLEPKNYLKQALKIYPELLADEYCKDVLKSIKKKMVKQARAGKFEINGKYTFLIPDLYAFCQRLFQNIEKPTGLLHDGEVFCNLFPLAKELACLRSPHLYREYGLRRNVSDHEKKKWFTTIGLYTSTHDLISKLLQFDVDGDKSLVCADNTIIRAAKRNMDDIVPLYYEMGSASPVPINQEEIYKGLSFAFSNSNIGTISNDITKIWSNYAYHNGVVDTTALECIKLLCMENNFVIDAAKTLVKLKRPENKNGLIREYTAGKLPHFFFYAKDKMPEQIAEIGNGIVDHLHSMIKDQKLVFSTKQFNDFNYRFFMLNRNEKIDMAIVDKYFALDTTNKFNIHYDDTEHSNIGYIYQENRKEMLALCADKYKVTDVLVGYLYGHNKHKYKEALWYMFGDVMLHNLKRSLDKNFGEDTMVCAICASRIKKNNNRQKYCLRCADETKRKKDIENNKILRNARK